MKTLFIAGFGDLAQNLLQQIVLQPGPLRFVIGARTTESAYPFVNLCRLTASQHGYYHEFAVVPFDANHAESAAQALAEAKPDVIFNAMTRQSWWVIFERLDAEKSAAIAQATFGPWLPMHLAPAYKLMQARQLAGLDKVPVINAAFPDVVNTVLATQGMIPACGIGNAANNVPAMRQIVADKTGFALEDIRIAFHAAHYVSHKISRAGACPDAPYILQIFHKGEDISSRFAKDEIFASLPLSYKRPGGRRGQGMTAASAASILNAVLLGQDTGHLHAPGVGGLPGGYAVKLENGVIVPRLDGGLTVEDLIATNLEGLKADGIEKIGADGEVTFGDRQADVLKNLLGYDCRTMKPAEAEFRAQELAKKFDEFRLRSSEEQDALAQRVLH